MRLEYIGLSELSGSLIALEGVKNVAFDEMAEVTLESGERRYGRVILIDGDRVVLQVFEGTRGISLENASTHFTGKSMDIALSKEMLGRVFDGAGRPMRIFTTYTAMLALRAHLAELTDVEEALT